MAQTAAQVRENMLEMGRKWLEFSQYLKGKRATPYDETASTFSDRDGFFEEMMRGFFKKKK